MSNDTSSNGRICPLCGSFVETMSCPFCGAREYSFLGFLVGYLYPPEYQQWMRLIKIIGVIILVSVILFFALSYLIAQQVL
jgi:hypothetical protein